VLPPFLLPTRFSRVGVAERTILEFDPAILLLFRAGLGATRIPNQEFTNGLIDQIGQLALSLNGKDFQFLV
jgi:hypothetical protein